MPARVALPCAPMPSRLRPAPVAVHDDPDRARDLRRGHVRKQQYRASDDRRSACPCSARVQREMTCSRSRPHRERVTHGGVDSGPRRSRRGRRRAVGGQVARSLRAARDRSSLEVSGNVLVHGLDACSSLDGRCAGTWVMPALAAACRRPPHIRERRRSPESTSTLGHDGQRVDRRSSATAVACSSTASNQPQRRGRPVVAAELVRPTSRRAVAGRGRGPRS